MLVCGLEGLYRLPAPRRRNINARQVLPLGGPFLSVAEPPVRQVPRRRCLSIPRSREQRCRSNARPLPQNAIDGTLDIGSNRDDRLPAGLIRPGRAI